MFRFFLLVIVVFALVVFMRLVLLRLKMLEMKPGFAKTSEDLRDERPTTAGPRTIDAPPPLEVKSYKFTNFDYRVGPPNGDDFYENFYIHVGEAGSSDNGASARTYSLYVTTPKAISSAMKLNKQGYKFGRHMLVVARYDMDVILRAVRDHINDLGLMGEDVT